MGGFNKYLFLGSFFHLTQYCSLCGLHLFTGGEGQGVGGIKAKGCGGFKTNLNKNLGGVKANNSSFSNGRVRQEDGMNVDYIYLRAGRIRPGGEVRVKTNLIFCNGGLREVQNKL